MTSPDRPSAGQGLSGLAALGRQLLAQLGVGLD
jgi:hypothetical protein